MIDMVAVQWRPKLMAGIFMLCGQQLGQLINNIEIA